MPLPKALVAAGALGVYAAGSALAYQMFRPKPTFDDASNGETFDSLADRWHLNKSSTAAGRRLP